MGKLEEIRKAVQCAFNENWEAMDKTFEKLSKEEPFSLIPASVSVPSPFVRPDTVADIRARTARQTLFFMGIMPLQVDSSIMLTIGGVTLYDVAEALMASFVFGEFSVKYMPIAKRKGAKTIESLTQFLERLGLMDGEKLTGMGNAVAKALLNIVAISPSTVSGIFYDSIASSVFLSAAIANTLHAELADFNADSVKTVVMEARARYRRIRNVVEDWLKSAPKLYLRDTIIFYEWEDAVKDAVIKFKNSRDWLDHFRFTL